MPEHEIREFVQGQVFTPTVDGDAEAAFDGNAWRDVGGVVPVVELLLAHCRDIDPPSWK
jgi:hypothetical protein